MSDSRRAVIAEIDNHIDLIDIKSRIINMVSQLNDLHTALNTNQKIEAKQLNELMGVIQSSSNIHTIRSVYLNSIEPNLKLIQLTSGQKGRLPAQHARLMELNSDIKKRLINSKLYHSQVESKDEMSVHASRRHQKNIDNNYKSGYSTDSLVLNMKVSYLYGLKTIWEIMFDEEIGHHLKRMKLNSAMPEMSSKLAQEIQELDNVKQLEFYNKALSDIKNDVNQVLAITHTDNRLRNDPSVMFLRQNHEWITIHLNSRVTEAVREFVDIIPLVNNKEIVHIGRYFATVSDSNPAKVRDQLTGKNFYSLCTAEEKEFIDKITGDGRYGRFEDGPKEVVDTMARRLELERTYANPRERVNDVLHAVMPFAFARLRSLVQESESDANDRKFYKKRLQYYNELDALVTKSAKRSFKDNLNDFNRYAKKIDELIKSGNKKSETAKRSFFTIASKTKLITPTTTPTPERRRSTSKS